MTLPTTPLPRLLAAALAALALALAASVASAHDYKCRWHHNEITGNEIGLIWHSGSSLYGCSTEYDEGVFTRRLGPWTPGTKVVFDGADVVWTVRRTVDGAVTDRVWAGNVHDGVRWLRGARLVPQGPGQPFKDGRVYRLLQTGEQAGWITTTGDVVAATERGAQPTAVGTPPAPLVAVKQLVLIGSFPAVAPATLAAHAHLTEGDGETDDCGGSNPYTLTVRPDLSAPAFGATWYADFTDIPIKECG